jgi:hypothetical protein
MNPVTNVTNVSSAVSQQTIDALQLQMARYTQSAIGQDSPARADYKALQAAIQSGKVTDAQAALARLQRDSQSSQTVTAANSPAGGEAGPGGSVGAPKPWIEGSVDITA